VQSWLLPTLSEVLLQTDVVYATGRSRAQLQIKAEREWSGALAALTLLLQSTLPTQPSHSVAAKSDARKPAITPVPAGVVICGPLPLFSQGSLLEKLSSWVFVPDSMQPPLGLRLSASFDDGTIEEPNPAHYPQLLSLLDSDPLTAERFCWVVTSRFSLVLLLGENAAGEPQFFFSFEPTAVRDCWKTLLTRLRLTHPRQAEDLEGQIEPFAPIAPDYQVVMQFSQWLLQFSPELSDWPSPSRSAPSAASPSAAQPIAHDPDSRAANPIGMPLGDLNPPPKVQSKAQADAPPEAQDAAAPPEDVELLRAITHEVRTPLATIRTLTRLLLRRRDLAPEVIQRLETIDRECTEQIDRFGLIFQAAEMGNGRLVHLAPTPLGQLLSSSLDRWQVQAQRRNLTLTLSMPEDLPRVVSEPTLLDQALTGLIDRFTRHLAPGSQIEIDASLAGDQLKLKLQTHCPQGNPSPSPLSHQLKSIGQLLAFQPETGSVSLNLKATKHLFQLMGGRLVVKEGDRQEVLTVFLPLDSSAGVTASRGLPYIV
jgi:signal transduction histidine kinase